SRDVRSTIGSWHPQRMAEDELHALRAQLELNRLIDELVEEAMRARRGLSDTMDRILPALCKAMGARGAFIRTFNEDLELTLLCHPHELQIPDLDRILEVTDHHGAPPITEVFGSDHLFARALD